jgi:hypothetical protein
MPGRMWGKSRFRNGVSWLWIEKQGRELLSRPELTENCSAKRSGTIYGCWFNIWCVQCLFFVSYWLEVHTVEHETLHGSVWCIHEFRHNKRQYMYNTAYGHRACLRWDLLSYPNCKLLYINILILFTNSNHILVRNRHYFYNSGMPPLISGKLMRGSLSAKFFCHVPCNYVI